MTLSCPAPANTAILFHEGELPFKQKLWVSPDPVSSLQLLFLVLDNERSGGSHYYTRPHLSGNTKTSFPPSNTKIPRPQSPLKMFILFSINSFLLTCFVCDSDSVGESTNNSSDPGVTALAGSLAETEPSWPAAPAGLDWLSATGHGWIFLT